MRKSATLLFLLVSAIALTVVLYNYHTPQPTPELPKKHAPSIEPQNRAKEWKRIVVTCTSRGRLFIDGQPVATSAGVAFENKLRARESELHKKLPEPYRTMKKSIVAVSLDMEPGTTLDIFFDMLDVFHRIGFAHVWIRTGNEKGYRGHSLFKRNNDLCQCNAWLKYWGEMWLVEHNTREVRHVWVRITDEGNVRFSTRELTYPGIIRSPITGPEMDALSPEGITAIERYHSNRKVHKEIERLFDILKKYDKEEVLVMLDLRKYAKNLTWGWLVKLLSRMEKMKIEGYALTGL